MQTPAQVGDLIARQRDGTGAEMRMRLTFNPGTWQQDVEIGDDALRALMPGQRAGEPLLHARMRGDDRVRLQHIVRPGFIQQGPQRIDQGFQTTGAVQLKAGFGPAMHAGIALRHCLLPLLGSASIIARRRTNTLPDSIRP